MHRGFKSWAEEEALKQRERLGLQPTSRLSARALAEDYRIRLILPAEIPNMTPDDLAQLVQVDPDSWSAFTVVYQDRALIVCNPTHTQKRFESDVMHELAHRLCGHHPSRIIQLLGTDLNLREYDANQEEEAAWLGGCLQLSRPALLWASRQGMTQAQVSDLYVASSHMVAYRMNVTGVDRQLAAMRRKNLKRD